MSSKSDPKPHKGKTTKAERRALQEEAQRTAKAAGKGLNGLCFDFRTQISVLTGFVLHAL